MTRRRVRRPLSRRLPLLAASVLGLVAAGISWAGYRELKQTVLDATATHLSSASQEIRDMLQTSLRRLPHDLAPLAHDASVRALVAGSSASEDTVRALLGRLHRQLP